MGTTIAIKNCKFLFAGVFVIIFGLVLGSLTTHTTIGAANEKRTIKAQGWSYTLQLDNGVLDHVEVNYKADTVKDIEDYATAQRLENEQLFSKGGVKRVEAVGIVFKRYLSQQEADAFVKKYQIIATGYDFRTLEKDNPPGNVNRGVLGLGVIRNGKTLQGFGSDIQIPNLAPPGVKTQISIQGIIGMQVSLDYAQYQKVSTDPDVYLVEMDRQVIKAKLQKKASPALQGINVAQTNLNDINLADINISYGQLFRHLEDLNMVKAK
jgi:hypothetical protein